MKISNRIKSYLAVLGSLLMMLAFQNMTLKEFGSLNISNVDESARRDQARQLLGAYYRGSFAQKLEGKQNLNYLVYKKIDSALGLKYKSYVPDLARAIIDESQAQQFDPVFILAVIQTESSFNPKAKGTSGELGLMQILPKTAEWIAKKNFVKWEGEKSLYDPVTNIKLGILYFAHLRSEFDGTAYHYLPAYNMGAGNIRKITRRIGSIDADGKVMKRDYAIRVMRNYYIVYKEMISEQKKLEKFARDENELIE